jgi:hypothetical protein
VNDVHVLLDAGAMVDGVSGGFTPLERALRYKHDDVARLLGV